MDINFDDKCTVEDVAIESNEPPVESPNAIQVDEWARYSGKKLARDWQTEDDEAMLTDAYHVAFDADATTEPTGPSHQVTWWNDLLHSDAGRNIRQVSIGNHPFSEMVAASLKRDLEEYLKTVEEDEDKELIGTQHEKFTQRARRMRSIRKATARLEEDAEVMQAVGYSMEATSDGGDIDSQQLAETFRLAKHNPQLVKILRMAGRMMEWAKAERSVRHQSSFNVNGVRLSGIIKDVLSSQLVKLTDDALELELLDKIAKRRALSRDKRAPIPMGKGPVMLIVDESTSMEGDKIIQAKAFALCMAWLAKQEKRWFAVRSFSYGRRSSGFIMPPTKWNQGTIIEWCHDFLRGGTDFNMLNDVMANWRHMSLEATGKTDVIFLTDGEGACSPHTRKRWDEWRKEQDVHCQGIAIEADASVLQPYCDSVITTDQLNAKSTKQAMLTV